MRVLAISGSLRRGSYNTMLLEAAAELMPRNVEVVFWRDLAAVPAFDSDIIVPPRPVTELQSAIRDADAVLFATPEYNHSIPGALKNALDWISRRFPANVLRDKPVAVIGASRGMFGAAWAQAELRTVLKAIGAAVKDDGLLVSRADEVFAADGGLKDGELALGLAVVVARLVEAREQNAA